MANSLITAGAELTSPAHRKEEHVAEGKPVVRTVCMYRLNPDGVTVDNFTFEKPEDIPPDAGWVDSPAKVKPTAKPLIDRTAEDAQVEKPMSSIEKARAALAEKRARLKAEQEALEREEKETNG